MGMKSGHIQDYQITASSIFRTVNMDMFTWEPGKARLDKQGKVNAWTAGHSDQSQWLQVRAGRGWLRRVRSDVTGVCRKRLRSDLIDAYAVWWDADSTFETPPFSSRYHPWKQSVIGSISLLPFEHDSTPTQPVPEEFSPVELGYGLSITVNSSQSICLCYSQTMAEKVSERRVSKWPFTPQCFLFFSLFFFTVNMWDWWKPVEFHLHTNQAPSFPARLHVCPHLLELSHCRL